MTRVTIIKPEKTIINITKINIINKWKQRDFEVYVQKTTLKLYWNISPCNIIYKTTVLHYWGKNNCTVCSPTWCGVKRHFPRPDSHKKLREEGLSETGRHETVGCIQSGLIHRERELAPATATVTALIGSMLQFCCDWPTGLSTASPEQQYSQEF